MESRCLLTTLTPDVFQASSLGEYGPFAISEPQAAPVVYEHHQARFDQLQRYQTFGRNQVEVSDEFFDVVPGQKIGLRGWAKSGDEFNLRFDPNNQQSFGVVAYDADYLQISAEHVLKHEGAADTVLTAALRPGDTSFTVADATGWSIAADPGTRSLAWYGYSNSHGQTFGDYTYTRNVATNETIGLWSATGINAATGTITLNEPWSGPLLPSGTAVRNATNGPDHSTIALDKEAVEGDFTFRQFSAVIEGIDSGTGTYRSSYLPAATAHLKVIIQSNQHGELNNQITWREIELLNIEADATIEDLAQPDVESFSSADFPIVDNLRYQTTARDAVAARSSAFVAVQAEQLYQVAVDMMDISTAHEQPVAIQSFDADHLLIHSLHVTRFPDAADTHLAADLLPGQTNLVLDDATGWSNSVGSPAESRSLAWFGYQNSTGFVYPDYTYTRNVASNFLQGMWSAGGVEFDEGSGHWTIELNEPWSGPSIAAGTAIRNATGHDHEQRFNISTNFTFNPVDRNSERDRFEYQVVFGGGIWQEGVPDRRKLRPGTEYIKVEVIEFGRFGDDWLRVGPVSSFAVEDQQFATFGSESQVTASRSLQRLQSDQRFTVDTSTHYVLSATLAANSINTATSSTDTHSLGYLAFDSDDQPIFPEHVQRYPSATDTRLTFALSPGDQVVRLNDASGWSNADVAGTRALAWYGYSNAEGHRYDDYTYTRTVAADGAFGLWDHGAIQANQITLREPWAGPFLPAGTAVRNAILGNALFASLHEASVVSSDWTTKRVTLSGEWENGFVNRQSFPPGTASIRLTVQANESNFSSDDVLRVRGMSIAAVDSSAELAATEDSVFDLDVLSNDSSFEFLRIIGMSQPEFGSAEIVLNDSDGRDVIRYTAAENFVGTDRLTYTVRNSATGQTSTTSASITINGLNLASAPELAQAISAQAASSEDNRSAPVPTRVGPRRQHSHHTTESGLWLRANDRPTLSLLAFSEDADQDRLAFRLVSGVSHGVLNFRVDGSFEYQSSPEFSGADGFEYEVTDGLHTERRVAWITVSAPSESLAADRLTRIGDALLDDGWNTQFPYDPGITEHYDEDGNPLLSWRVHILPQLGYWELYTQFRLNEPWDSPHNLPLLSQMPQVFRDPGAVQGSQVTRYQVIADFENPRYPFLMTRSGKFLDMGTRRNAVGRWPNSILVAKTAEGLAVPWTAPIDTQFNPASPITSFSTTESHLQVYMFDGRSRTIHRDQISDEELTALVKISGDDVVDVATIERRSRQLTTGPVPKAKPPRYRSVPIDAAQAGLYSYYSDFDRFPLADVPRFFDGNGYPLLSWRVHVLPFLGLRPLYEQFHLDEPWDSEHNLTLLQQMPDAYRSLGDAWDSTSTRFQVFTGSNAPFLNETTNSRYLGPDRRDLDDMTGETISVVETIASNAVPWTAPQDIQFDIDRPLAAFDSLDSGSIAAAPLWGRSFSLSTDIAAEDFAAMVTPRGAELPSISRTLQVEERRRDELTSPIDNYNRLVSVSFAMQNYQTVWNSLPVDPGNARYTGYFGSDGRPNLSWRVHILPYLGEHDLFSQFHLDEPWDSENNLALLEHMPAIFRHPNDAHDSAKTRIQVFDGPGSSWEFSSEGLLTPAKTIADGGYNTTLIVESGPEVAVEWTRPTDIDFAPDRIHELLGTLPGDILAYATMDTTFTQLKLSGNEALVAAMVTPNGGEDLGDPLLKGSILPGISSSPLHGQRLLIKEGKLGTIEIVLDKPGDVTLQLDLSHAGIVSPDKTTLQFTTDTWNIPQTITFLAADDSVIDDPEITTASISVVEDSTDDEFDDLPDIVIPIFNVSDDVLPSFHIVSPTIDEHLTEGESSSVYRLVVGGQPTTNVTFQLNSNDASEAAPVPRSITVTPENAHQVYTFVVEAGHDGIVDGDQAAAITVSVVRSQSDDRYDHLSDWIVPVVVSDIDQGIVTVGDVQVREAAFGNPVAQVPVTLDQTVESSVTVGFTTADDSATGGTDYESTSGHVVFDANAAAGSVQFIDIPIIDDRRYETDETFHLLLTTVASNGTDVRLQQEPAIITIVDNDLRGIYVSDASGQPTETGGSSSFQVRLTSQPSDTVTINLESSDETEGLPRPSVLTFTPDNWTTLQTVIVDGIPDTIRDGEQDFQIILNPATGADYDGIDPSDIDLTNLDTFIIPDIELSVPSTASEGETVTATVSLSEAPSGPVVVSYQVAEGTAGLADYSDTAGQLTFTSDGPLTQQFEFLVFDDTLVESTETLSVILTEAQNGMIVVGERVVSIPDNDLPARPELNVIDRFPDTNRPTFTWPTVAGAVDYDVWLSRIFPATARIHADVSRVSQSQFSPPEDLTPGYYKIWVRARAEQGNSRWSFVRHFEIRPTVVGPTGPTFDQRPMFEWNTIPHASAYELYVTSGSGIHRFKDIEGTSFRPTYDLGQILRWWVRPASSIGNRGYSSAVQVGTQTQLTEVSGRQITWDAVGNAGRYVVQILNTDTRQTVIRETHATGTTFTLNPPLPAGNYKGWVKAIDLATDDFGSGQWSKPFYSIINSQGTNDPLPRLDVSLVAPAAVFTVAKPLFIWTTADGADRYQIFVNTPAGQIILNEQTTETQFESDSPFENGRYRVWIRAISDTGRVGEWSDVHWFSVELILATEQTDELTGDLLALTNHSESPLLNQASKFPGDEVLQVRRLAKSANHIVDESNDRKAVTHHETEHSAIASTFHWLDDWLPPETLLSSVEPNHS